MKRFFTWVMVLVVLACAGVAYLKYRSIPEAQDAFETVQWIYDGLQAGKTETTFFYPEDDLEAVYDTLEAIYPYAFSLSRLKRADGLATYQVDVSRPARQKYAREFAKELAQSFVTEEMDDRQKLRALHDGLIRMCVYDIDTALRDDPNGDTAPFAADGALLDHLAVCSGYGRAFVMLCEAVEIRAVYIASQEMNHGWNAVCLDGEIYYIDCTFDDPVPDRGEYVCTDYFLKTKDELRETHTWNTVHYDKLLNKVFFEKTL